MSYAASEADRRIANLVMVGVVVSVDAGTARAVVRCGDITTPALVVGQLRAGALSFWWLPTVGEQVVVICPGGDIARGIIICAIFAGNAPSQDAGVPLVELGGGIIKFNGSLEVTGDVVASGISLVTHTHPGVDPGPGSTGEPQ